MSNDKTSLEAIREKAPEDLEKKTNPSQLGFVSRPLSNRSKTQTGKGLDVGTAFIYCAQKQREKTSFKNQRDAFFDIEFSDFSKQILGSCKVKYIQKQDRLYIVGDEAIKFANVFNRDTRRPLSRGVISPEEKDALPMVELIIKNVLGDHRHPGEIVYYSLPASPIDSELNLVYHENIIRSLLEKWGYQPKPINEGLAVIFSELSQDKFTGLGLSFGGGMVNVCLSWLSIPVFTFSLTRAGDWIDQQVAQAVGETASKVCAIKENSFNLDKAENLDKIEQALSIYYDNLIEYVLIQVKKEIEKTDKMPKMEEPIPIVLAGGTAQPAGFAKRFKQILDKIDFPLSIKEVKMASKPLYSVAKGALIAAIADEKKK